MLFLEAKSFSHQQCDCTQTFHTIYSYVLYVPFWKIRWQIEVFDMASPCLAAHPSAIWRRENGEREQRSRRRPTRMPVKAREREREKERWGLFLDRRLRYVYALSMERRLSTGSPDPHPMALDPERQTILYNNVGRSCKIPLSHPTQREMRGFRGLGIVRGEEERGYDVMARAAFSSRVPSIPE